jgi:ethanolamine utilization protein EutN
MFLARIDGTLVSTMKHATLQSCRFLIGQRLENNGQTSGEPLVILDWLGATDGCTVIVTTDGDLARQKLGNTTPSRLVVVGIVDQATRSKLVPGGAK